MLLNLKNEINRHGLSAAKIAKSIGISDRTMSKKVTEESDFTRKEMYLIHESFFPETDFYRLFKSEKVKKSIGQIVIEDIERSRTEQKKIP